MKTIAKLLVGLLLGLHPFSCTVPKQAEQATEERWACTADADCRNSCRYGAVSKAWYDKAAGKECDDGCDANGFDAPRCEQGTCTAYFNGRIKRSCTRRP